VINETKPKNGLGLSGGVEELAGVHLRDPGSNLGSERKYFLILFVCLSVCVTFESKSVGCLTLLMYMYIDKKCWIPENMLPKTLDHSICVERDHLKM
jgi:hypothetical protein